MDLYKYVFPPDLSHPTPPPDNSHYNVRVNAVYCQVDLYKYVFPPDLSHPTLAVIGCIQPLGAIMPISEMQCRLAAGVMKVCCTGLLTVF